MERVQTSAMTDGAVIAEYRSAIRALREGRFNLDLPASSTDEVGKLGAELLDLASHLERKFEEVSKLQKLAVNVSAGLFIEDILDRVYESFRTLIPYDRIGCAFLSDDRTKVIAHWARSEMPPENIKPGYQGVLAGSSLQQILDTGLPRIINDLEAYYAEKPDSVHTRMALSEGIRSSLTCPLVSQAKPIGFLFFSSRERNVYKDVHQGIFMQIAGQLSILIEKSRLYEQLFSLNQKLLAAERELTRKATYDALTGVYNRGAIFGLIDTQIARAQRLREPFAIVMIDIDHFKQINDVHGHVVGDMALRAVAETLKGSLREYDQLGRFGGEEFIIILGDVGRERALETAERLRAAVAGCGFGYEGRGIPLTISIGVTVAETAEKRDADAFVAAADRALYRAKRAGRNRVEADEF